jgi:hypothetical protein
MSQKQAITNLSHINKSQLLTAYCVFSSVVLFGLCLATILMFKYMQTINDNVTATNRNVSQTDKAIMSTN